MQSRLMSMVETITNVVFGFMFAVAMQVVIFPLFDIHVTLETNVKMTVCFTILSMARSYLLRRFFNWLNNN